MSKDDMLKGINVPHEVNRRKHKSSLMSVPVVNCPIIWKIPLNKEDKESFNA